jgi:carboxylesterase
MPQIIPTAEPFFFPGGRTGCLLVHGFTGAPKEMRWMGEYLAREGFSTLGVRLTGHATRPQDMARSRYTDWIASVEDGYHLLSGAADRIYLVGLSMGGVLALLMASRLPVKGLVAMSTPYKLPDDPRLPYAKYLALLKPYLPKNARGLPPDTGWFDKAAWKEHISYPENPLRSITELVLLLDEMRHALPAVRVPALLVHSHDDNYVVKDSMQSIYRDLGTADKTTLWVEGSGHVIPREPAREQVFRAAAEFIRRVEHSG